MTNYDYDGLSFQVLAERHGPFALEEFPHPDVRDPARYVGDRFVSTYLHGPLGPIARTAEGDNDDVSDNRDHYYLRDAMGGHMGVILDDDGDVSTAGHAAFATYDAFGNAMSGVHAAAGAFAWRGGEGSVTEREPDLVYMQARHYSPEIGRFVQADTVLLASMTTQGMNRYAYVENDPVSASDPSGHEPLTVLLIILALVSILGFSLGAMMGGREASSQLSTCGPLGVGVSSVVGAALLVLGLAVSLIAGLMFLTGGIIGVLLAIAATALLSFLAGFVFELTFCAIANKLCEIHEDEAFNQPGEKHAHMSHVYSRSESVG